MTETSRRRFVQDVSLAAGIAMSAGAPVSAQNNTDQSSPCLVSADEIVPLDGAWEFRLDPGKSGEEQNWQQGGGGASGWEPVSVPHTWQTTTAGFSYLGVAWYRKVFDAPSSWRERFVRIEFEAVFHSAKVWLNGKRVGEHLRKGYTAFTLDLSPAVRPAAENVLVVRVDNAFDSKMLPRNNSFDWTPDGGITRPVSLLVSPWAFIERVDVDAIPDPAAGKAVVDVRCLIRNAGARVAHLTLSSAVSAEDSGRFIGRQSAATDLTLEAGEAREVTLPRLALSQVRFWHFDRPHLYRLHVEMRSGDILQHTRATTFGVREFSVRGGGFYLNGERVWLMGVERMAGSHPEFGMAEPDSWIAHDHNDMKELNCVFTRVHWQQDKRVLDYCDRHGILIQVEVPSWGAATFEGMSEEPSSEIMENGLEQLREMIGHDRNHPSVFAWGLCNEIGGQNPPAYRFAKRLYEEARRLDPRRLRSYASNSLQTSPAKDVAGIMDFIEWNEYYESWFQGSVESVRKNLADIGNAFPDKPIVISEYGYCECDPKHTGGDERRIEVLRAHTGVYREFENVAGAIFFCYNDYRTHIGDKGLGVLKQRVHGVVDVYGTRKPSFERLRREASPVEELEIDPGSAGLVIRIKTRKSLPAYSLEGYSLRCVVYGFGDLPMEQEIKPLPKLPPGGEAGMIFVPKEKNPRRVKVDVMRPTGFSAATAEWR
jgi:beta-glucuronidase